jgi:hypothetical protein
MASPRNSAPPDADDGNDDIPKRMMRGIYISVIPNRLMFTHNSVVKVLYTFDDANKTNCLARLPNALLVPVIPLDESTEIGIVELSKCIQAIVAARYCHCP